MIMTGIDKLISRSLSDLIKNELNSDVLKNIERKLFLEYGMSIKLSIEHFDKFLNTLKKYSNLDSKKFAIKCINKIIKIKKSGDDYFIRILDQKLIDFILELFGDGETRRILNSLTDNELTIPKILTESNVPKTSGYRKIENLIIGGLIIESGKILSESKRISKYRCIFDEIKIEIKKNEILVQVKINKKIFEGSSSVNIVC